MGTSGLLQLRRGAAAQIAVATPAQGEVWFDETNNRLVVGDGSTVGGWPIGGGLPLGPWTSYTPTITADTGAVTTGGVSAEYLLTGKTLALQISVQITASSGSPSFLKVTLPSGIIPIAQQVLSYGDSLLAAGESQATVGGIIFVLPASGSIPNAINTFYAGGILQTA